MGVDMTWIWLGAAIAFGLLELVTAGLVSIWFSLGALLALAGSALTELSLFGQMMLFVLGSTLALIVTRPLVRRYVSGRAIPTNADRVLGQCARVTETIDNQNASGAVYADGKTWTARSVSDALIPAGEEVRIVRIEGVKLLVEPVAVRTKTESEENV